MCHFSVYRIKNKWKIPVKLTNAGMCTGKFLISKRCKTTDWIGVRWYVRPVLLAWWKKTGSCAVSSCCLTLTWWSCIVHLVILLCCFQLFICLFTSCMPIMTPLFCMCQMCSFVGDMDPCLYMQRLTPYRITPSYCIPLFFCFFVYEAV